MNNPSGRPIPNLNCFANPDADNTYVTPSPRTQRVNWAPPRPNNRPVRVHNWSNRAPYQLSFLDRLNNSRRVSFRDLNIEPSVTFIRTHRTDPSTWPSLELDNIRPDNTRPDLSEEFENINLGESP